MRVRGRWDAHGWLRPAAYTLFGLTPPWEAEDGGVFRTTESGQMLFNRCPFNYSPSISLPHGYCRRMHTPCKQIKLLQRAQLQLIFPCEH